MRRPTNMSGDGVASMVVEEWEEEEAREPTNPYHVLYIKAGQEARSELTERQINAALASRMEQIQTSPHQKVLAYRLERAAAFLNNWEQKDDFDTKLTERQEQKIWAILRYSNAVYEGFIKEGSFKAKKPIRHGTGITSTVEGERYEGMYEGNKRHGFGWQFWANGDFYRGQWKRDMMQGCGQYFYSNGDVYTGMFDESIPHHNKGRFQWVNGDVYLGEFVNGERTGKGKITLANEGGAYTGEWFNGKEHGQGEFVCGNGNSYKGQFESGWFHGEGVELFPNGEQLKCHFVNGRADGDGLYTWANGDKYEGQFRHGQPCGEGTFTGSMAEYTGEWNDGAPEGAGHLKRTVTVRSSKSKDKSSSKKRSSEKSSSKKDSQESTAEYTGQWEGGLKEGHGVLKWPNGNSYSGEFRGDRKHGQGIFTWANSNRWQGSFWLDVQHGEGTYTVNKPGASKKSSKDSKRMSVAEPINADVGDHHDLYHHGLLCERDGLPVQGSKQEDPLEGPRASIRGSIRGSVTESQHTQEEIKSASEKRSSIKGSRGSKERGGSKETRRSASKEGSRRSLTGSMEDES